MKAKLHKIFPVLLLCLLLLFLGYCAIAFYYQNGFSVNTWINGIYCTGKSIEEINSELLCNAKAPVITIVGEGGIQDKIDLADCGFEADYRKALQKFLDGQNGFAWIGNVFNGRKEEILPEFSIDKELLYQKWLETAFVKEEMACPEENVTLTWTDKGYRLDNTMLHRLDVEGGYQRLLEDVGQEIYVLNLSEDGLYSDKPYTAEQLSLLELWEKITQFAKSRIVYDMGAESIVLEGSRLEEFLIRSQQGLPLRNEEGKFVIDSDKAEAFITQLTEEYNTIGREREFLSTRGDVVTVPAGTYGTQLDAGAELDYLTEALMRCVENAGEVNEEHIPAYSREAYSRGRNDIGDTYIEIDLTEQKMYFYHEGKCEINTDIVTGNLRRRMGTPEGVYYVYAKQRNRVLRGPGYASPVKYWMPVNKGIGIHDASWRKSFGGEIYKTNGSHGCINTPGDVMKDLYELTEVGMPVIIFY